MGLLSHSGDYYGDVAAYTAHICAFLVGTFVAWNSPMTFKLTHLEDNPLGRTISDTEQGVLASIGIIGSIAGISLSGISSKKYGRKLTSVMSCVPVLIAYVILCFAKNIWVIYLCKVIGSTSVGAIFTILPMYIGEISRAKNRGRLASALNIYLNTGTLFAFAVGPHTTFVMFNMILAILSLVCIVLVTVILPETPYFIIQKDMNQAKESLKKLRGTKFEELEFDQIVAYKNQKLSASSISNVLSDKNSRKALIIASGLFFFQQSSGISVLTSYNQNIFEEVNNFLPSDWSSIIVAFMQVIFSFVTPIITDRSGRKILLLISYIGIVFSMGLFGLYFFMKEQGSYVNGIKWLPLVALIFYKFTYSIGAGPIPFIITGEIFPLKVKPAASALASGVGQFTLFVLLLTFRWTNNLIGMGETFWIFSVAGIVATFFVMFFVFETKGRSLQGIQEEMNELGMQSNS